MPTLPDVSITARTVLLVIKPKTLLLEAPATIAGVLLIKLPPPLATPSAKNLPSTVPFAACADSQAYEFVRAALLVLVTMITGAFTPPVLSDLLACSNLAGLALLIPTFPLALMSILLVGAPGRIRNGRRDPLVTSRTKKFASFPATSQV